MNKPIHELLSVLGDNKHMLYALYAFFMLADIFLFPTGSDIRKAMVIALWLFISRSHSLKPYHVMYVNAVLLVVMFALILISQSSKQAETIAIYVYLNFLLFFMLSILKRVRSRSF